MTATPETGERPDVTPAAADESPLVTAPAPQEGWFVSLVPPPDSLPLEVDLRGPSDPVPVPPARVAEAPAAKGPAAEALVAASAAACATDAATGTGTDTSTDTGTDTGTATATATATDTDTDTDTDNAIRPAAPVPPELSPRAGRPAAARSGGPATTTAAPLSTRPGLRSLWQGGLPTPAVVAVAALVLLPGVVLDLARDGTFGLPSAVFFVVAAAAVPLLLRTRSLAVGAVLPPLLFAGAATAIAWRSGLNQGTRQIGLDVGTTMAVNAPLLFGGTALALAVVAGRLLTRLVRR